MATDFPNSLDTLANPNSNDALSAPSHSEQHSNANDAIEALQIKVGIDNSQDQNSLDYKINNIVTIVEGLGNNTDTITEFLGLEGNNDLTVTGIENRTTIDSFSKTTFSTVRYVVQLSKNSEIRSVQMDLVQDGSNFYITETDVSSNTDNLLGIIEFEENSGIISLVVTPVSNTVNARFYRTALKI